MTATFPKLQALLLHGSPREWRGWGIGAGRVGTCSSCWAQSRGGNKQQLYGGLGPLRLAPAGHRRLPIHAIHLRLRARPHGVRAQWYCVGRAQSLAHAPEVRQM